MFYAIVLILAIILSIVLFVVGMFLENILVFDSIGLAILAGALANYYLPIHPAFCLLIGIGAFVVLIFLQSTMLGFWLISLTMSLCMGLVVATIVHSSTGNDRTWTYVSLGIAFVFILGLHIKTRNS